MDEALKEYMRVKDDLQAGRTPPAPGDTGLTLKRLCDTFLTQKKHGVKLGELTQRSFDDYWDSCQRLCDFMGKGKPVEALRPDDLLRYRQAMTDKEWGPARIGNEVTRVRSVLKFAFENGLIDRPVRYGEFKSPKRAAFRRRRQEVGPRLFTANELRCIIDAADVHMQAMILLGVNAGMGNADVGSLPISAMDLPNAWLDFPRRKTGIDRRCPLWPETVSAVEKSISCRREPVSLEYQGLLFITKYGAPWFSDGSKKWPLSAEFRKLLDRIDSNASKQAKKQAKERRTKYEPPSKLRRPGLSFYALRHTFQTVADELGDYIATRHRLAHLG